MLIMSIDANRFYAEYQKYVQNDMKKRVEWFVDEGNVLHMFIFTDHGFGYEFQTKTDNIPPLLQNIFNDEGRIFDMRHI